MEKREGNWETRRCGVAQSMNFVQSFPKLVKEQEIYLQDTHTHYTHWTKLLTNYKLMVDQEEKEPGE